MHTNALSAGSQVSLSPKFRTQQTHTTLYKAGNQLPNVLALWHFIEIPHHECMNSSCRNARHDGYSEFATKIVQPRMKGNQTSPALLREMNKLPSLQSVQESSGAHANPSILRELNNCSLWKASTKYTHRSSYYQPQPSGLTEVLRNLAIHYTMTTMGDSTPVEGKPLRTKYHHLGPVTQDDKARECEMMYTLTLALPKSMCAQERSRSFIGTKEQTANTLTSWHCQDLLFAREDMEEYKIQTPTSMTLLQNAHYDIISPCMTNNPRCPSKGV